MMKLSEIKVGDVLQSGSSYGDRLVVVTRLDPSRPKNSVVFRTAGKAHAANYVSAPAAFVRKVGFFDLELLSADSGTATDNANDKVDEEDNDAQRAALDTIKPNAPINIRRYNGKIEQWTFVRHLPRGRRFLFVAKNRRGTAYKFPLEQIVV